MHAEFHHDNFVAFHNVKVQLLQSFMNGSAHQSSHDFSVVNEAGRHSFALLDTVNAVNILNARAKVPMPFEFRFQILVDF